MSEQLKHVSPEYQAQLDALAERLCTPERFGKVATAQVIDFPQKPEATPDDAA